LIVVIICQMVAVHCGKYNVLEPGPVRFHLTKTGDGSLNVSFSDTVVDYGSKIMLSAIPGPGSFFLGWYGDFPSTLDSVTLFVNRNMTVEARFRTLPASAGLVEIPSKDRTFLMGSDGAYAQPEEKPVHPVRFTYTFFIDNCAITQKQYLQVMGLSSGSNPALQNPYGIGDSFPIYNVTWYQAALFCNARSKAQGYDTVYSYTALCQSNPNCPYALENLEIHYEHFGYRLPTEAEWEFACRAGTTTDYFWGTDTSISPNYAWFSSSGCQKIGLKLPNAFGLYDMAGNVSEWVNDQLGQYPIQPCVDPIGPVSLSEAQFFAIDGQRPVRGGSWKTGASFLRSSSRKYEYDTPAKVYAEYIGFRTVLGAFFPQAEDTSKPVIDTSGITVPAAIASDLINAVGTSSLKCVFTKGAINPKLYYIDFSEPGHLAHAMDDSLIVHDPTISPNGKYAAYSTNSWGSAGQSIATIRSISPSNAKARTSSGEAVFLPKWWTDPASGDTFVVYTNGASMNNASGWKQEKTLRRQITGGAFSGTPEILCDSGSFYGGLSADGRFLATGYPIVYAFNLINNDLYRYFLPPINGLSDTVQVCNVSISPQVDRPDEVMFLDFGSNGKSSSVVGKPYGAHTMIFTCNSALTSADAVRWYEIPSGFSQWNEVKWSNHPNFGAAIASSAADQDETSIFIINLTTKERLNIASGKDLKDAYIWIDPIALPQQADPYIDFANYDVPVAAMGQKALTEKLKLFWSRRNDLQCVFVGSSPTLFGIDPSCISRVRAINMGAYASPPVTSFMLVQNYALKQLPNLNIVAMGLDPGQIQEFNLTDPYLTGMSRAIGYEFDKNNNFWQNGLPSAIINKIALFDSSSSWPDFYSTGFTTQKVSNGWGPTLIDRGDYDFENDTIQRNFSIFKTLADTCAAHSIHLLVIEFPESPGYKQTNNIGRLGPFRSTYQQIVAWLRSIEQANPYFHFYDANMNGDNDYTDAEALDCNHLGYLGAKKLSTRIDSLFGIYLK
jgi:formylglycine-generating enzyme required for sulfatase activity